MKYLETVLRLDVKSANKNIYSGKVTKSQTVPSTWAMMLSLPPLSPRPSWWELQFNWVWLGRWGSFSVYLLVKGCSISVEDPALCLVAQSCLTLCNPMDYGLAPLSMGILQALEWVAMPSFKGASQPKDRTQVCCIAGGFFIIWATREAHKRFG